LSSVGFGIGLIAAAIASTATTSDAVVTLGLESVATVFRLAVALQRTSRDIEDSEGTWSRIISGFDQQEVEQQLEKVNATLRPLKRAYIGQILPEGIVIAGPPSTLDTLSQSHTWALAQAVTSLAAPARCLMFCTHLPSLDNAQIVGTSPVLNTATVQRPLYSAHSVTDSLPTRTFKETLRVAVADIGHKPAQVEDAFRAVATALQRKGNEEVVLTTVGSTWNTSKFSSILEQHGQSVSVGVYEPSPKPYGNDIDSVNRHEIAVVGMSGRFPESDTLDELWELLKAGTTADKVIPPSRFCVDDFYDPSRRTHNALLARHGCFIKKPGDFDHRLFNISPREALQMDPVQRMLLMTTYEALEMAGYSPADNNQHPPRIATYFGQTVDDWKTINEQQGIDTHFLPAVNRSFAPGRIGHFFQWAGGFYSIDTGCSSSATALCLAREALASGECDAAVVGGGTLLNAPEWFSGLSQGGFLSPTGACKTYSDAADGYCRGEGVAVVVLKRIADAVRSKDNILGVVAGAARNCNAGAASITYPGEQAQAALYRRVLRQAAVRPQDVSAIEMHGTGTQAGDKVEMHAVQSVFAPPSGPRRQQPLVVGAIKANIGHSEAAAGVISLIKSILMLHHNTIPPQPGQPFTLNPHLKPILGTDIQLANGQAWTRNGTTPRYVLVNNFDAAGGNVSLLLHDTPSFALQSPPSEPDKRSHHVVVISGRTVASQKANRSHLLEYLKQHPGTLLADLAYTTTARRLHHVRREAYVAQSTDDLLRQLQQQSAAGKDEASEPVSSVVFVFTGQGSQHMGMGGMLYRTSPTFKRLLDSYQSLCDAQGLGCQFLDVICASGQDAISESAERDMQVATVALEIALSKYWQSLGVRPTLLIGHSLGEYAALCVAGVLSVGDALAMACERASLIFTSCVPAEAGMLAVGLPVSTVHWRLRDSAATAGCEVTCINGPSSTVVGGPVAAIEALESYLKSDDASVTTSRLRVQFAFHTRQMDPLLDDLEAAAKRVTFQAPTIAVASTLLGRIVQPGEDGVFNAQYLRRHTREPVAFLDAVRSCEEQGLIQDQSFVVEVGPHPVCIGLLTSSLQKVSLTGYPSLRRGRDDWGTISHSVAAAYRAQLPVAWAEFHKDHLDNVRMVTDLPTYAFDNKEFWHSYKTRAVGDSTSSKISHASSSGAYRLSSTCLHSVKEFRKEESQLLATFDVDLSEPNLAKAIGGHVVDGVAICPASIFMDMAYTAAAYLDKESRNTASSSSLATYELADLSMLSPLVLREHDTELPQVFVEGVLEKSTDVVSVRFLSRKKGVATPVEYGSCLIHLNQPDALVTQAWSRMQPLVKARVRSLDESLRPKQVHSMDKTLFYKVFSEIVDYSAPFHAVEEATVAADFQDAVMTLHLAPTLELGTFTCSPFAIDALVHVAGFLLNADVRKPKNEVHIANHIGSLRVLGDLSSNGPFRAYTTVREQDAKTGISRCDVYLTNAQDKLVALCTDICFRKLERDFFAMLTGSARTFPKKLRAPQAIPRREWQAKSGSSSDTSPSATPTSEYSSSTQNSLSDVVDLSADLLTLVAEHCGMSVAELNKTTGSAFTELGVDSQMSISILGDFQKATAVELPAAFFTNFPTPADVRKELGNEQLEEIKEQEQKPRTAAQPSAKRKINEKRSSAAVGPSTHLLKLVADALGLEASDVTPSTMFESMGMDSMLSIRITSTFLEDTGIELPAAFFSDHPTVAAAREELDGPMETTQQEETTRSPSPVNKSHLSVVSAANTANTAGSARQDKLDTAVSRSVLIQGQSRSSDAPLFMTTDGSGTVESYIHLSALPKGRRIYALESPFLQSPDTFDLSIQEMASIFIRTIRRIQPQGPYMIGGWSAGSMYAYEVAHRLTTQGETIQALIILDMRAPSLIPTSIVTNDFVDKLGTFEGINRARDLPEDLSVKEVAHLMGTCRALSRYDAPKFPANRQPRHVAIVWAKLGLDNRPDAPIAAMCRPGVDIGKPLSEMVLPEFERYFNSWFYGRREQFGTNGWEDLLGDHISVHVVDGGQFFPRCTIERARLLTLIFLDHFSMMCPPFATAVGKVVSDTVTQATAGN
jgi:iterative type I PKS product template protein